MSETITIKDGIIMDENALINFAEEIQSVHDNIRNEAGLPEENVARNLREIAEDLLEGTERLAGMEGLDEATEGLYYAVDNYDNYDCEYFRKELKDALDKLCSLLEENIGEISDLMTMQRREEDEELTDMIMSGSHTSFLFKFYLNTPRKFSELQTQVRDIVESLRGVFVLSDELDVGDFVAMITDSAVIPTAIHGEDVLYQYGADVKLLSDIPEEGAYHQIMEKLEEIGITLMSMRVDTDDRQKVGGIGYIQPKLFSAPQAVIEAEKRTRLRMKSGIDTSLSTYNISIRCWQKNIYRPSKSRPISDVNEAVAWVKDHMKANLLNPSHKEILAEWDSEEEIWTSSEKEIDNEISFYEMGDGKEKYYEYRAILTSEKKETSEDVAIMLENALEWNDCEDIAKYEVQVNETICDWKDEPELWKATEKMYEHYQKPLCDLFTSDAGQKLFCLLSDFVTHYVLDKEVYRKGKFLDIKNYEEGIEKAVNSLKDGTYADWIAWYEKEEQEPDYFMENVRYKTRKPNNHMQQGGNIA